MNKTLSRIWVVSFVDKDSTFGPVQVDLGFPIGELDAAMHALRKIAPKEGFSLNVKFVATPIKSKEEL